MSLLVRSALVASLLAADVAAQRRARAVRTAIAPVVDGVLEELWDRAEPIGDLVQVEPVEGAVPSESTDIRFLYDEDHLYIGMRFHDREPGGIIATSHERDAGLFVDDRIEMVIDTFRDKRNAFFFQINAAGSKGDGLITGGGSQFNKPWDGLWEGEARVDAGGWSAEMAIPFKTLNFREGLDTWGFNCERFIGRRNESARWNAADQDTGIFLVSNAGELTGIEGIRQGVGLDVVPFFVGTWSNDQERNDADLLGDPGVDAFYKFTPNLTLSMTVNTDFAETEVDDRQINLTRFPLFFPERRDFFLQDSGQFAFSQLGNSVIPFFSRRIGLTGDGREVPIVAGAKLTGRVGDYNIGLLDVQTDDVTGLDGDNSFVARIEKNVGEQSSVGGIVTHGNPGGTAENTLVGLDATYRTTTFLGDQRLFAGVWGLTSDEEGVETQQNAFGAFVSAPNDVWSWSADFREVQRNFDPALGFVRRRGVRQYSGGVAYMPRIDDVVRQLEFGVNGSATTSADDVLQSWSAQVQPFGIDFQSGDSARVELTHDLDRLPEDFEIAEGVTIPAGEYDWDRWRVEYDGSRIRDLSVNVALAGGEFFEGDRIDSFFAVDYRTGPLFTGSFEWIQNDVDLPEGEFTTRVSRLRTRFSFSPKLSWNSFVQWDNVSETFGVQSTLRWIPTPGQEVYLVFDQTLDEAGRGLATVLQQVAVKVSYTFRF